MMLYCIKLCGAVVVFKVTKFLPGPFHFQRILSFLSVGFGLLADIDIESERLRVIGESRFAVWAVARCASECYAPQ